MTMLGIEVTRAEDTYRNVAALYTTLLEGRDQLRAKRVELNMNNEVQALPLDFVCDVELRSKQALSPRQYALFCCYALNSSPELLPLDAQLALGTAWYAYGLDLDGSYRSLYFRIKNQMERDNLKARAYGDTEPNQFD